MCAITFFNCWEKLVDEKYQTRKYLRSYLAVKVKKHVGGLAITTNSGKHFNLFFKLKILNLQISDKAETLNPFVKCPCIKRFFRRYAEYVKIEGVSIWDMGFFFKIHVY